MSLHLGNLSSRVRREELERVFRRFGRCNVQVKDKYGFVVYDYPINAERALKTLRGKRVCGEPITLSWSNRQPRPVQRYPRGGRSYEPLRERHSSREDRVPQNLGSSGRKDYERGFKQVDGDGGGLGSADQVDEPASYHLNDSKDFGGEKRHTFTDDIPNEGEGAGTKLIEDERWGAEAVDPSKENGLENGLDFDRYDPYYSDVRKEQEEDHNMTRLVVRKSEDIKGMEQVDQATLRPPNNGKLQNTCYICGEVGHKMRKCPRELKRLTSRSQGRLHKGEAESSRSRNHEKMMKREVSPLARVSHRGLGKDFGEKKRSRGERESPDMYRSKKPRGPVSTSIYSDYTPSRSRSRSRSLRPLSGSSSHSRSKSMPSQKNSASNSRSGSVSNHSRSRSPRSSSPTSLSLSLSLRQPSTSSPNKVHIDQKDSLVNAASPEMKGVLVGGERLVNGDERSHNSKLENMKVIENEIAAAPSEVQEDVDDKQYQSRDDTHEHAIIKSSREVRDSCTLQAEIGDCAAGVLAPQSSTMVREFQNNNLVTENALAPAKNSELEVSGRPVAANSMNISPEEICMVLKHYGLEHPQENEKDLPVETFFGSARLWPWEIIYYRRLKKGPISTENYAQRIAQNREFGIVDKYIRSSSGWGELGNEDP